MRRYIYQLRMGNNKVGLEKVGFDSPNLRLEIGVLGYWQALASTR